MNEIISLLEEKVLFLERFHAINEHELINFAAGDFENVEAFYMAREKLLEVIRAIDKEIDGSDWEEKEKKIDDTVRARAQYLLGRKNEIVETILTQDLQVLALIEEEKSKIIRELQNAAKTRKLMGAYRSDPPPNQLNEKV